MAVLHERLGGNHSACVGIPKQEQFPVDYRTLSPDFCKHFNVGAPYVAGAMAGGIASVQMVQSLSKVGVLSFFGSGGLSLQAVENALESYLRTVWCLGL